MSTTLGTFTSASARVIDLPGSCVASSRLSAVDTPATLPQQELSDENLVRAIASGAEWAIEALYVRYARYAYALAYRVVHDNTVAEDVVQDAFLSIWRKASSYHEKQGHVRSWLQAIVHHRAVDYIRAASHRDTQWISLQRESEQHEQGGEQFEVWDKVWHEEQQELIRIVLSQLPVEQRQVIVLAYFGGYTHSEIAARWNIPLGTVKGRMRLGLQKMKHLLSQHGVQSAE